MDLVHWSVRHLMSLESWLEFSMSCEGLGDGNGEIGEDE